MQLTAHPIFNYLNPVALHLGPVAIHWYGIAYAVGVILGYLFILRLDRDEHALPAEVKNGLITWAMLGIIIGGRIGYVLVYNWHQFIDSPLILFKTWIGGMSFHGGVIGLTIALWLLAKRYKTPFLPIMDRVALVAPIGIFLGRLANFVNAELCGRITEHSFGIVFPGTGPFARHPSQLYEAMGEGLVLWIILLYFFICRKKREIPGATSALFLMGYGCIRLMLENFREPDAHLGFFFYHYTMGQILCLPMILLGIGLAVYCYRNHRTQ